ncbi:MAG: hypothetical protein A4E55_02400 [Pelotomaculum sp. PtaU1.Bin035]|nr:MAG: hypothetical protein A4E55_02400 [Pelotomaculum sp. PtaU1.Bin035]
MRKPKLTHSRKLVIPDNFKPRLPNDYDKTFLNGYFHFIYEYIEMLVSKQNKIWEVFMWKK